MPSRLYLSQLVDKSLCDPEIGAVNFNCLRTLLHAIVSLTHIDREIDVESHIISKDTSRDWRNEAIHIEPGKCDGEHSTNKNQDWLDECRKLAKDISAVNEKMDTLTQGQQELGARIQSIQSDLKDMEGFPSNDDILSGLKALPLRPKSSPTDATDAGEEKINMPPKCVLSSTWIGIRNSKRIEAVEDGLEKLFSLFQDVVSSNNRQTELQDKSVSRKEAVIASADDTRRLSEMDSRIAMCCSIAERHQEEAQLSKHEFANLEGAFDQLSRRVEMIQVELGNNAKFPLDHALEEPNVDWLQKWRDDIESRLSAHSRIIDANTGEFASIKSFITFKAEFDQIIGMVHRQLDVLRDNIAQLQECSGNMDNKELNGILENVEQLKKMTSEIEDLRKLSSLKELADHVDSLSDVRLELDELSNLVRQVDVHQLNRLAMVPVDLMEVLAGIGKENLVNLSKLSPDLLRDGVALRDASFATRDDLRHLVTRSEFLGVLSKFNATQKNAYLVESCNAKDAVFEELGSAMNGSRVASAAGEDSVSLPIDPTSTPVQDSTRSLEDPTSFEKSWSLLRDEYDGRFDEVRQALKELSTKQSSLNVAFESLTKELASMTIINGDSRNHNHMQAEASREDGHTRHVDLDLVLDIQHLTQENRALLDALRVEFNALKKRQSSSQTESRRAHDVRPNTSAEAHSTGPRGAVEVGSGVEQLECLQNDLLDLQEEVEKLSGHIGNIQDDTKEEFHRKQEHIDALYGYIEQLQSRKADKEHITVEMDVKADKEALDCKVNQTMFDERYRALDESLREALTRIQQYENQEAMVKDTLNKLCDDVNSKLDSAAELKLRKYLEERLKDIQKSRDKIACSEEAINLDQRNAAGLRKPVSLFFHCISCDRPIDVNYRGSQAPVPSNFPLRHSKGPYTSYEVDQLRQKSSRLNNIPSTAPAHDNNSSRPCGGIHTTSSSTSNRLQKPHFQQVLVCEPDTISETDSPSYAREFSVIDCVLGKDGHIYRGRFKSHELPPAIPKRPTAERNRALRLPSKERLKSAQSDVSQVNPKEEKSRIRSVEGRGSPASPSSSPTSNRQSLVALPPINQDHRATSVSGDVDQVANS